LVTTYEDHFFIHKQWVCVIYWFTTTTTMKIMGRISKE
jgi:hypothetical protein